MLSDSNSNWKFIPLTKENYQKKLKVGEELKFDVDVNVEISRSDCETDVFICIRRISSNSASFKEILTSNDINCLNLNNFKNCTPSN